MTCCIAIALVSAFSVVVIRLWRGSSVTGVRFFQGWRDVFDAWRESRTRGRRGLFALMLGAMVARAVLHGGVVAVLVGAWAAAAAACGADWSALFDFIRGVMRDFYDFILRVAGRAPLPVPSRP